MTNEAVRLVSLSSAMDGSFTAIADVAGAIAASGTSEQHRLIGGVAVMLHIQRLQLDLPIRATADADFGVPPHILLNTDLITTIEALARTVRTEDRDVGDLWRCLEIAAAEGITPSSFTSNETLHQVQAVLWNELGPNGRALSTLTVDLQADPAARLRTRVRALITETVGTPRRTR